jgi:hypothetical protein
MALLHDISDRLAALESRQDREDSFKMGSDASNGHTEADRLLPRGWITRCDSGSSDASGTCFSLPAVISQIWGGTLQGV